MESDPSKRIKVVFFKTESNREPVRDWLKFELDQIQRHEVGTDLRTVELRWPLGMPTVRKIQSNLWEVRTTLYNGIARVFFTVVDDRMILLHGIVKKSQRPRLDDLETARKRLKQVRKES